MGTEEPAVSDLERYSREIISLKKKVAAFEKKEKEKEEAHLELLRKASFAVGIVLAAIAVSWMINSNS